MTVFIAKGDAPLSARQAIKRGLAHVDAELARAGARGGDATLLQTIPHADLPPRLAAIVAALGYPSYADFAAHWEKNNEVNGANNLFNHQLAAYRKAKARLARYRLADGREVVTEEQPDLETGEITTVVVFEAIDPLPTTIEAPVIDAETGEQTGTEQVPNPMITQDDAERAAAQAVIDAMPDAVKDFDA